MDEQLHPTENHGFIYASMSYFQLISVAKRAPCRLVALPLELNKTQRNINNGHNSLYVIYKFSTG